MKQWIGRWLMVVAGLHTVFALVVWPKELLSLLQRGLFNTVGTDPMTGAVVWFVLFGFPLFILGLAISAFEQASKQLPASLGWSLLGLTLLGVVLMPASGFWMMFPPSIEMVRRSRK